MIFTCFQQDRKCTKSDNFTVINVKSLQILTLIAEFSKYPKWGFSTHPKCVKSYKQKFKKRSSIVSVEEEKKLIDFKEVRKMITIS